MLLVGQCYISRLIAKLATVIGIAAAASGCSHVELSGVSFSQSATTVEGYDLIEVTANVAPAPGHSCFTESEFSGWFERQDGSKRWTVEGFCDAQDGRVFRIRFMPPAPGEYKYFVAYRADGKTKETTGSFRAINGHRRGPVRVDSQYPWHFIWEGTGEHYFFNGTTAYWLAGWSDEGIIRASIDRLHRLKVNRIRVTVAGRSEQTYGEPVKPGPTWTSFTTAWPAESPDDIYHPRFDYTAFHVSYWQKLDRLVQYARERDMVVSLVLDMNDSRVHPAPGSDDEYRFLRYAVARLAAYSNVTWDLGDDLDQYRDEQWTRRTGMFLKNLDPYQHLATSHPVSNSHQDRTADWFDFTSFQEWSRHQHAFMLKERRREIEIGRIIPQTNEEYGYEDHYPSWSAGPGSESSDALRRTAWDIAMAGGYQTTGETARRGTNVGPDSGGGWVNGRGDDTMTMLQGYGHMVDFFTSFEWWKTEPHDELVGPGGYCLAQPGQRYVVYLPHGGTTAVQIGEGTFRGSQFNPRNGEKVELPSAHGPVWNSPVLPDAEDWAFLLERK